MKLVINTPKSVIRTDEKSNRKKKDKLHQLIEALDLQNFESSLITTKLSRVTKSEIPLNIDLSKAGKVHLPTGAERLSYIPTSEYGIIYIPINRLKSVYQTEKATNKDKVKELKILMQEGKKLDPVTIGYVYDIHDGHHRWVASKELGYSHVPCEVKGTDKTKVREAKRDYRQIWKSVQNNVSILQNLETSIEAIISKNIDINKSIESYITFINNNYHTLLDLEDVIMEDSYEYPNLNLVLSGMKESMNESLCKSGSLQNLVLVVDLTKGGQLNRGKLIKRRVSVKGKNGTFYREQWVNPNKDNNTGEVSSSKEAEQHTYSHSEEGIKEMEARQSNKFPVVRIPVDKLKIDQYGYRPDEKAISEAIKKYHEGEPLPVVRITPQGKILTNQHLYEMAKRLGLSHIPTVVVGNTTLKKEIENKYREQTYIDEENENGTVNKVPISRAGQGNYEEDLPQEVVNDLNHFKMFTAKQYPHSYLMEQAKNQGIEWNENKKDGTPLPKNSGILWMRAHEAICSHIKDGWVFEVERDDKQINKRMKQDNKDPMEKYFLKVFEHFNGDKQKLMEYLQKMDITWKDDSDPSINWMRAVSAAKHHLAQGKMLAGIRTRQKGSMKVANAQVTDHIKAQVTAYGKKYGKQIVMDKAQELGIEFETLNKKGKPLPSNSNILWMRAHESISMYIAQGNKFSVTPEDEDNQNLESELGKYGDAKLSKWQSYAMDWAVRNSQRDEERTKAYALKCFKADQKVNDEQAQALYDKFMRNARNSKLMIMFDPTEKLSNGVNLLEQLSSDNTLRNNIELKRGVYDKENVEANEGDLFGRDYTYNIGTKDRPVYGVVDLYNTGLKTGYYGGSVAFVMKDDVKKRATGCHIDSNQIPYGQEGKWVKPLSDPHQLLVDRWYSKWKTPKGADGQRRRAMNSVLEDTPHLDDIRYFEAHIHGDIDFKRDIDHILVPASWKQDKKLDKTHKKLQDFAKLHGINIEYEE